MSAVNASRKVGRSIEEVMVRRKFDAANNAPVVLPDITQNKVSKMSQSVPNLRPYDEVPNTADSDYHTAAKPKVKIIVETPATAAHGKKGQFDYLNDYSEADKVKMMESLIRYTQTLKDRVETLEAQLVDNGIHHVSSSSNSKFAMSRNLSIANAVDVFQGGGTRGSSFDAGGMRNQFAPSRGSTGGNIHSSQQGRRGPSTAQGDGIQHAAVNQIMSDIDYKVFNLKEIFRKGDPIADRKRGAELIGALVRGYLCRQRLQKFRRGIREWRWVRCRPVTYIVDILLANHSKRDVGFHLMKTNRTMKTLTMFFGKWAGVCRQNAPVRRMVKQQAEEKINRKRLMLLRKVFDGLRSASVGDLSTRNANAVRRKLIDSIRLELSEKYKARTHSHLGVVPEHEVQKILHRRVLEQFTIRQKLLSMKFSYNNLKNNMTTARKFMKAAIYKHFSYLAGKCFYAWSNYIYMVALGLDRKRWPGPRKYEVKYNQKRVDNFSRLRYQRCIFSAWKAYFRIQSQVKRRYQRKLAQFMGSMFHAWAGVSHTQHRLRELTYKNWKEYPRVMMMKPFEAWANHVKAVKNHDQEQLRICKAYVRWKWRQRVLTILKVWRHQALYGRIDGLYSRQMLLKTLAEQKFAANLLEKHMADQTLELEECRTIVAKEIEKRKSLEDELKTVSAERDKNKMTNHHFEQELRRVQSIIDCMVSLNPHQIKHIQKIQPDFRFKERNIVLSKEPSAEEKVAAAAAKLARKQANEAEDLLRAAAEEDESPMPSRPATAPAPVAPTPESEITATDAPAPVDMSADVVVVDPDTPPAASQASESNDGDAVDLAEGSRKHAAPTLSETGPGLSTIAESTEMETPDTRPTTPSKLTMRPFDAPHSPPPNLLMQTHKNNSRRGAGFNDSSSTIDIDTARTDGNEEDGHTARTGSVGDIAKAEDTNTATASPKTPAPESAADSPTKAASDKEEGGLPGGPQMSEEDRVLLLRVKWLLSRFHDDAHQAALDAHTKSSLELMKDAQVAAQQKAVAAAMASAESNPSKSGKNTIANPNLAASMDSIDEMEEGKYPLLARPSLLPVAAPPVTEIVKAGLANIQFTDSASTSASNVASEWPGLLPTVGGGPSAAHAIMQHQQAPGVPQHAQSTYHPPFNPAQFMSSPSPSHKNGRGGGAVAGGGGGTFDSFSSPGGMGLGSFSTSPSQRLLGSGKLKTADQVALETADAVAAAIAAANDPQSSKAPFEPRAPPLKSQVRQLSKQFGSMLRQSSAVMYRSLRGNKQMSMSMRADSMDHTDDSVFEDAEEIPLAEIDEMDCLKNASVKILLSFIEFLENGNVSSFQPEDKRDWVKSLLKAAAIEETQEELDIKEAARFAAERWGGGGTQEDQDEALLERVPAPLLGELDRGNTMKRLDSSSALITVDGAESAISWRTRLMQLRALNSNAGNASGKTEPLEDDKEISMFRRILEMREKLEGIIQLQTIKYQRQLALMLKDSKHKRRTHSDELSDGADGSPVQAVRKFGGAKIPPPIKTTHFTPGLAIIESPANAPHHGGSNSVSDRMGYTDSHSFDDLHDAAEESPKKPTPGLGANIYAGNLKMISKVEQEEQRKAQERFEALQQRNV